MTTAHETAPAETEHGTGTRPGPDWVRDAVFYQIFPERFDNADPTTDPPGTEPWGSPPTRDNFMGGDLPGIARRLPHLRDLGVTALYLTPIFAADTNHRYDTTDYLTVDPALGGDAAFDSMLAASREVGIRVVLDAVFHHCGIGHPYFRDVVEREAASPYVNWFQVTGFPVVSHPEPNYETCSGCWYLPKLNVNNPEVRDYLFGAARKWSSSGIDGWRLDVPYMLDNLPFWRQFREQVKGYDPEQYIVAEVWEKATEWADGSTSDGAMNYRLRDAILDFVSEWRTGGETFAARLEQIDREIPAMHKGLMLNLLGSHDTERVLTHCGGDVAAAKLAFALLFTAEGAPMVYYGDEVGMTGFNDPDCRGAMSWDRSTWDVGMLDWLRTLARVRRENVALRRGSEATVQATENVIVRVRRHPEQEVLVVANRGSGDASVSVAGYADRRGSDLLSGARVSCSDLSVDPRGVRLVAVEP